MLLGQKRFICRTTNKALIAYVNFYNNMLLNKKTIHQAKILAFLTILHISKVSKVSKLYYIISKECTYKIQVSAFKV